MGQTVIRTYQIITRVMRCNILGYEIPIAILILIDIIGLLKFTGRKSGQLDNAIKRLDRQMCPFH